MKAFIVSVLLLFTVGCAGTLESFRADVDAQIARVCDEPVTEKGKELCAKAKEKLQETRDKVDEVVQ